MYSIFSFEFVSTFLIYNLYLKAVVKCVQLNKPKKKKKKKKKKKEKNRGKSIHEVPTGMTGPELPWSGKQIPQGQREVTEMLFLVREN